MADGTLREVVNRQFTLAEPTTTQDVIRVNFQSRGGATPEGYVAEIGQAEALHANGLAYGWADGRPSGGTNRNKNEDARLDSFCSLYPNLTWRIALPEGRYRVTVGVGDAEHPFVAKPFQIEDVTVGEDKQLQGGEFATYTEEVTVTDGVLELGCSDNGGTRVTHVEIERIGE